MKIIDIKDIHTKIFVCQIGKNQSDVNQIEKEIKKFSKSLCNAYNMPLASYTRFLSIFQVDIHIGNLCVYLLICICI